MDQWWLSSWIIYVAQEFHSAEHFDEYIIIIFDYQLTKTYVCVIKVDTRHKKTI